MNNPGYMEAEEKFFVFLRDITERKRIEGALWENEAQLEGLVQHLPDGVCLLDRERRLTLANPVAQEYLRLLGNGSAGRIVLQLGGRNLEDFLDAREDGLPHEVAVDGPPRRVFEVVTHPIREEGVEKGWTLVLREVTEEQAVQEKVQRQDRLAAVGQLAAGIAHDFNNMLSVVMGTAQILQMRPDFPEAFKEDMNVVVAQGQRAAQLVRQILDFSRQTVAQRQAADLTPFLKETVKLLARTLPEHIRIVPEFGAGPYVVDANLTQLQQVITNLSVNARDAMPDGGNLRIGLSPLQVAEGKQPPVPGMAPGNWVVWTVLDTGTGMSPEVVARLYEPFFTTKAPGEGTGLGLAQVYGIVKQHKGFIDVASQPGAGTTFTIYLPQVVEEAKEKKAAEQAAPRGAGETILVVEDQEGVRKVVEGMLEGLGYRVITAGNGQEGLSAYDAHREQIGLVVTDMVMPQMGGLDLFAALKERNPDVRVVLMTGYASGGEGGALLPEDIAGLLSKPLSIEQVGQAVREALPGEPETRDWRDGEKQSRVES